MTTIQDQLREALVDTGEQATDIICFWQDHEGDFYWDDNTIPPIQTGTIDQLPQREYDQGHGRLNGPPFLAFGPKYVYVHVKYDGLEWIVPVPRHPEFVKSILPWLGC